MTGSSDVNLRDPSPDFSKKIPPREIAPVRKRLLPSAWMKNSWFAHWAAVSGIQSKTAQVRKMQLDCGLC